MTIETHRFRNDTATRKRLMVPESFQHPAKGQLGMWALMVERYSQPGDTVLDPMAGSGATLLAALMGRNVVVNELEHHFLLPMVRSWAKMRQSPMLGSQIGDVQFLWGDARNLSNARLWPYQELAVRFPKAADLTVLKAIRRKYRLPLVVASLPLPDASVGAAITSPPYMEGLGHGSAEKDRDIARSRHIHDGSKDYTYTRPVDTIVTSPPFEQADQSGTNHGLLKHDRQDLIKYSYIAETHGKGENIGNLRNAAYWDAMRQVYAECWRVLKPGGILALVLKGFTRDGKYQDLPGQTEALLLDARWQKHDHWRRELWSLSFWRILQKRRDPAAWDDRLMYEEVLAFRKPGGEGTGVDTVITSPPYANRLADTFTDDDPQRMSYSMGLKNLANNGVRYCRQCRRIRERVRRATARTIQSATKTQLPYGAASSPVAVPAVKGTALPQITG